MTVGVLASHEGTTLQSVFDACASGRAREKALVVDTLAQIARGEIRFVARTH